MERTVNSPTTSSVCPNVAETEPKMTVTSLFAVDAEPGTALPGYLPKKNQLRSNLVSEQTCDPTRPLRCDLCSVIITEGPEGNPGQVTADCVLCQDCLERAIHSAQT